MRKETRLYAVASNLYMYRNFNKLEDALFDYFSFPFKVLDNFNQIDVLTEDKRALSDLWQEMYLIVYSLIYDYFVTLLI